MKSPTSAKPTISSNRSFIPAFERPRIAPFTNTFSRPVKSGLNPVPSSRSAATLPLRFTLPVVGVVVPAMIWSSVLLPEPFRPMIPTVSPFPTANETPFNAQNSRQYFRFFQNPLQEGMIKMKDPIIIEYSSCGREYYDCATGYCLNLLCELNNEEAINAKTQ